MEPAAPSFMCGVGTFVAAPPLPGLNSAWLSPRQGNGIIRRRRWGVLPLACQLEADDADENGDHLLRVTPVPTREEMLAWAEHTDKRIAAGEHPPFGSGTAGTARETGSLLSDQEKRQLGTVSELLSKRRQQDSPLSQQEEAALKSAIEGVSASVAGDDDSSFEKRLSGGDSGVGVGTAVDDGREVSDSEMVHNPIYGSREVRDKVYLYAWSLMKNKQEEAERRER